MKITFIPNVRGEKILHFQCSLNMTIEQILHDVNKYIDEHGDYSYIDSTEYPIYFWRPELVFDPTLWDK